MKVRTALLSVYDKEGLEGFARGLAELGIRILSTGGTYSRLAAANIPVTSVSEVTGFPEILRGRVKSLHPKIHGGILACRQTPQDMEDLARHGIEPIDLVVVNLYPFEATVSRPGVTMDEARENIDIGGPAMIRAAAKNFPQVAVVVSPSRYQAVLEALRQDGGIPLSLSMELALEAFERTAAYDGQIVSFLAKQRGDSEPFPAKLNLQLDKVAELRYGENSHQRAAFYRESSLPVPSLAAARQLQGKPLSFNNINDASAALEILLEYDEPTAVAVKHTNPCGIASAQEIETAFIWAKEGDPVSIFGGIVALNRPVDKELAALLTEIFLEVIIAPSFTPAALETLAAKPNLRLLELPADVKREPYMDYKRVPGGLLVQEADVQLLGDAPQVVTRKEPTAAEQEDLLFAWRAVKHVKSNAIVVAKGKRTLGVGAGQMNRITAAQLALKQAGDEARGAVLASDAFFPFPDVVQAAAAAGITAIIQPGGSLRDEESIKAADEAGISMLFTGMRHFKH
ncbi:MAG: bifunctional phosphoribosylaminoimidazolecarboxamide formyltransferase/IMP cyclohydrolase [Limnochordia bacterium]|nr:bifunctional phosphoribosylaminoimidazolecarboxamide formyltransferase/IMP cyclohydrolase [Bacillota bacterium]